RIGADAVALHRSSTASTRARASARYASRARLAVEVFNLEVTGLIREDLLHLRFGGREPVARLAQPLDPFLEQLQGVVEIELLALEAAHDLLEPLELPGEARVVGGGGWHHDFPTRAATSRSVTRSRTVRPAVGWAARLTPC